MAKILTKRFVLIMLAVVIAAGGIIWAIVANIKPTFKSKITNVPAAYTVSGNGSASVMVDNYLYFVGDYVATGDIEYGDNDYFANGKMPSAGIYRVKFDGEQPALTYEYDNTYTDEDGTPQEYDQDDSRRDTVVSKITDWDHLFDRAYGVECVVPKIAGHDNTAMWVFGNTLVYTTPNNLRNKVGTLRSDWLDFYRVDLNGKNHKLVYSAKVTTGDFAVWANTPDNIYLLINDNGTLQKINVNTQKATQIATEVTNVVFPQVTTYRRNANSNEKLSDVYGGVMSYVYYTTNRDAENTIRGNLMYRYQIAGNQEPEKIGDEGNYNSGITFTPVAAVGGRFIFKYTGHRGSSMTLYSVVANDGMMDINTINDYSTLMNLGSTFGAGETGDVTFCEGGFWLKDGILRRYGITTYEGKVTPEMNTIYAENVTKVLAVVADKIYVQTSDGVQIYSADSANAGKLLGIVSLTTDDGGSATLPAAILRPAHNDGGIAGTDLVFVHNANEIKVYGQNGSSAAYLRRK